MRPSTLLSAALGLSLCTLLAAASPLPQYSPQQHRCVEECLTIQEKCLLDSISMSGCVIAFDDCHNICVPLDTTPAAIDQPKTQAPQQQQNQPPNSSSNEKHKDVTHETDITPTSSKAPPTTTTSSSGEDMVDGNEGDPEHSEDDGVEDEDSDENPHDQGGEEDEDGFDDDNSGY